MPATEYREGRGRTIRKPRKPRTTSYTDPGAHIGTSRTPSYSSPSRNVGHSTYTRSPGRTSSPSYSSPKTAQYHAPSRPAYTPPPNYLSIIPKPASKPKPKKPSIFETLRSVGLDFGKIGEDRFKPTAPKSPELTGLQELLTGPLDGKKAPSLFGDVDQGGLSDGMRKFLDTLRGGNLAPEGYTPGAEKMGPTDFAWVPGKFKTKNGRLDLHWDREFIESSKEDFQYNSQYQTFLNDMMEAQFQDREDWLLGKNERKYNKLKEVLGDASQAAFKGDYNFLDREHPNLNTDIPNYREMFGVTPEGIVEDWNKTKGNIDDPYMKGPMRYRMDKMREHYEKLRSGQFFSFQQTQKLVDRAVKKYETKYNDSVEFGLASSNEERNAAAKAAGPAMPERGRSAKEQAMSDKIGEAMDPRGSGVFDAFFGQTKRGRKQDRRAVEKARSEAMSTLGGLLPTVKQMITFSVANGELDPNDEDAVEEAIDRFRNPNHPDTRAMYVSYAMSRNPEFDAKGVGLDFINDPVVKYNEQLQQEAKAEQLAKLEADNADITGPIDFVTDMWKSNPIVGKGVPLQDVGVGPGKQGVQGREGNEGALNASQLGWTFDKLSRLNYGMAGMANAWYGLDKDDPATSWVERVADPIALLTGKSTTDSLDEIIRDPSGLAKVADEGYQQIFRGSNLPGIKDDIVPITFSHVIGNLAAQDTEGNIYDHDWYQHIAGFALDVALDPLNLIGVGVVDDVLKVPTRVSKAISAADKGDEASVDIVNFLDKVQDTSRSPIAEKVYRVDQSIRRIGDNIAGKDYANDSAIWKPDIESQTFDQNAVMADIRKQMKDLHVQETKLKEDLSVEAMNDELRHIMDLQDALKFRSKVDFRFNRIAKRTETTIHDSNFKNPGGMFWRDYLDPLEKGAISRGFFDTEYASTAFGKAAKKAEKDLNRLWNDIDMGKVNEGDPSVVAKMEKLNRTIDQGYAVDKVTGKPAVTKKARIEEYRKSKFYQKPKLDPAAELAAAAKMSKEDFAKHFSDEDVHKALTLGPKMLTESDETAAKMLADANERIHYAKEQLAQPNITKSKKDAAQRALAAGYNMQSNVTIEGMLRYLDTLQDMRNTGKLGGVNEDVASKMNELGRMYQTVSKHLERETGTAASGERLDELQEFTGAQDVVETTGRAPIEDVGDYIGGFQKGRDYETVQRGSKSERRYFDEDAKGLHLPSNGTSYRGTDFFEGTFDEILTGTGGYKTRADQLKAIQSELKTQINELLPQLKASDEVTGFPPAQAIQVEQMVPADSVFRNKEGVIDGEKVANHLEFNPTDHTVNYKAPEGATRQEVAFLDIVAETIRAEYHGAYRAVKTELIKSKGGGKQVEGKPAVGKYESRLGPRPTGASLREAKPELYKKLIQGNTKDVKQTNTSSPEGWLHTDEDIVIEDIGGVKGVPAKRVAKAEQNLARTGGKRTKGQKYWDDLVAKEQRVWDKEIVRARELDAAEARKVSVDYKVTQKERNLIAPKAYKRALDGVTESLKRGQIERVPGNMRLTINEHAANLMDMIHLQFRADMARLKIDELNTASKQELFEVKAKQKALITQKRKSEAAIEAARKTAHATKKNMDRIVKDEHALSIAQMPVRATGRQMQLRLMGMRKNMQFTHNLFRGAEKAANMVPAKFRENFANYFVRPTKQLTTDEAIMFRAMWESKTPVIIKAHLQRLSHRMRDIPETERIEMFKSYRSGQTMEMNGYKNVTYEGPHMDFYDEVAKELREVEMMWNGAHQFYWLRPRRGETTPEVIKPHEIYRFLPQEYQPNMKALHRMQAEFGAITADMLMRAIKANGGKMQDMLDPFAFAWRMRLAADQARQYKALTHSIETTFGVRLPKEKASIARKLQGTGWAQVKGLDKFTLFPPEAMKDINKLLELAEPGPAQSQFTKVVDNALGYWKQSMTIYNPGYYTRNGIGEVMVSWLDGVNHPKWYRMAYRIHRYQKREDQGLARLIEKWPALDGKIPVDTAKGNEVLFKLRRSGQPVRVDDALRMYVNMGLKSTFANTDIGQGLRGLSASSLHDSKLRKAGAKANEAVHEAGEGFEDYLRMAHFLHAMEHSGAGTLDQAARYAAKRVTRSHFDYTDFSTFEKSVMLRAFPFYKWTRRGAPLMFAHLFMTPGKMAALPKAMDTMSGLGFDPVGLVNEDPVFSTSDVHDDKNGHLPDYQGIAPGWVKDLFAYQVSPAEDDEYGNYFRIQTPQVDGLNSILNAAPIPGTSNQAGVGMEMFTESGAYPLLNPAIKGAIELGTNQSMDPDFPYPIVGGEYNEMNGLNPLENIGTYVARNVSPVAGFLAKLSKNGNLGPLSMGEGEYREEHGYNESRDVASFVTGLGFYQGTHEEVPKIKTTDDPAVGSYDLSDIPEIRGRKAAEGYGSSNGPTQKGTYSANMGGQGYGGNGNGWINYPDYPQGGSGWINYPDRPWINYSNGNGWVNYGRGGSGGGSGGSGGGGGSSVSSGSGGSMEFWELIQALRRELDQGDVT